MQTEPNEPVRMIKLWLDLMLLLTVCEKLKESVLHVTYV